MTNRKYGTVGGKSARGLSGLATIAFIASLGAGAVQIGTSTGVHAMGEPAAPKIDCRKRKNRDKPQCKNRRSEGTSGAETADAGANLTDDQIYSAAYALAKSERYEQARDLLLTASNTSDPRILNYLGFTTRKLGDIQGAIVFYKQVLALKPDYAVARAYYGEALIDSGNVAGAEAQLAKIKKLCGEMCEAYVELDTRLKAERG